MGQVWVVKQLIIFYVLENEKKKKEKKLEKRGIIH